MVHSLVTPGVQLLDASFFAPYSGTLALGEYMPAYAVVAVPTLMLTGNPVVAHNVVVVFAYALAAVGAAALATRLLGAGVPALVAGLVFAYSPRLLHQAHNIQALSAFWLPWLFLALERVVARPSWGATSLVAGLGLGLALSSMTAFLYAGVALAVFVAAGLFWRIRPLGSTHALRLAVVGAPAAVLFAVYLAPYRALARQWHLGRTLAEVEQYSATPGDFLGVPPEHLLHRLIGIGRVVDLDHEALFPGIAVAGLAVIGLGGVLRDRAGLRAALVPYVVMAGVAAVLAFGPTLHAPWGPVPLPYRGLYAAVPGFDAIRTPRRFAAFVALGLALLAAGGARCLLRRMLPGRRRLAVTGLAATILVESIAVPFPGTVQRLDHENIPEVYRWLAAQDARTLALELPMGGDRERIGFAAFHLRRTVNGWSSYTPPHYHALVAAMEAFPDARSLALIHGLRPDLLLVDRQWLGPARMAALSIRDTGLSLERTLRTHLVYRPAGAAPPGVERLEATARVEPADRERSAKACVLLRNPGPGFVPLYPLHVVRLWAESAVAVTSAKGWLPLDLAPGEGHTACVRIRPEPATLRIRGEVEGRDHLYRFVAIFGGLPQPLAPAAPAP